MLRLGSGVRPWWLLAAAVVWASAGLAQADGPAPFRTLAAGVLTTIPPEMLPEETYGVHDVVELRATPGLQWTPAFTPAGGTLYQIAHGAHFRRRIWCLEFSFKPVRTIYVDIPEPSGKMQRKLIWYVVYRVKNLGNDLVPAAEPDGTVGVRREAGPVRFVPQFVLESHEYNKVYLDRILPAAIGPIQQREDPRRELLSTVEIARQPIPASTERQDRSVWGVATWEDVDPRVDFFSIYVQGLTNAYRWTDQAGQFRAGDPPGKGRRFVYKTLQLNFWRPGDRYRQETDRIRFGMPEGKESLYGGESGLAYAWVYR